MHHTPRTYTRQVEVSRLIRLTEIRQSLGWSQSRLSRESGVHSSTVSAIERGRLNPWPGQLHRIAEALSYSGDPAGLLDEVGADACD